MIWKLLKIIVSLQVSEEYHVYGGPAEMKFVSRNRPQTVDQVQQPVRSEHVVYDQVSGVSVTLFARNCVIFSPTVDLCIVPRQSSNLSNAFLSALYQQHRCCQQLKTTALSLSLSLARILTSK